MAVSELRIIAAFNAIAPDNMKWRGDWAPVGVYFLNEVVFYNTTGEAYICIVPSTVATVPTDPTAWAIISSGGAPGDIGPTGPVGPSGATGPTVGDIGPSGPSGATGATGPAGVHGAVGPSGATGPAGASGATGPSGPTGALGPAGSAGPSGATGPSGPTGPTVSGPTGPPGAVGATGPTGATGQTGTAGVYTATNRLVTLADNGMIYNSIDGGNTWAAATTTPLGSGAGAGSIPEGCLIFDGQKYIAGGNTNGTVPLVWSPDGTYWQNCTISGYGSTPGDKVLSIAFGGGTWVAVGAFAANQYFVSTNNGVSWTTVASPWGTGGFSIVYDNGRWTASGTTGYYTTNSPTNPVWAPQGGPPFPTSYIYKSTNGFYFNAALIGALLAVTQIGFSGSYTSQNTTPFSAWQPVVNAFVRGIGQVMWFGGNGGFASSFNNAATLSIQSAPNVGATSNFIWTGNSFVGMGFDGISVPSVITSPGLLVQQATTNLPAGLSFYSLAIGA